MTRPGQIYWSPRTGAYATICEVGPSGLLVAMLRPAQQLHRFGTRFWRNGVPNHYVLQYDPPERKDP